MMNNGFCTDPLPEGFLLGPMDEEVIKRDFSWASMITMMFYLHSGTFTRIETVADFKKAFSDFNDFIQQLDIPEPEVKPDEV